MGKRKEIEEEDVIANRYQIHRHCVSNLLDIIARFPFRFQCIYRNELDRQHLQDVDLVIAVGGDGTVLSASHFINSKIPLVGVNSDPTRLNF